MQRKSLVSLDAKLKVMCSLEIFSLLVYKINKREKEEERAEVVICFQMWIQSALDLITNFTTKS